MCSELQYLVRFLRGQQMQAESEKNVCSIKKEPTDMNAS